MECMVTAIAEENEGVEKEASTKEEEDINDILEDFAAETRMDLKIDTRERP